MRTDSIVRSIEVVEQDGRFYAIQRSHRLPSIQPPAATALPISSETKINQATGVVSRVTRFIRSYLPWQSKYLCYYL